MRLLDAHLRAYSPGVDAQTPVAKIATEVNNWPSPFPRRRTWLRFVGVVAAASVVLLGMVFYFHDPETRPIHEPANQASSDRLSRDDLLLVRFVEQDLKLADNPSRVEQFAILLEMAGDLRREAIHLAVEGRNQDLALTSKLYERLLERGLERRVHSLAANEQLAVRTEAMQWLKRSREELAAARAQAPEVAAALATVSRVTEHVQARLDQAHAAVSSQPQPPEPMPEHPSYRYVLLTALVDNGLRLSEESDPMRRADYCSDVADHLLQAVVNASAQGKREQASVLGKHLGAFVERGVSGNLARLPQDDPRPAELKLILLRAHQTLAHLEQSLDQLAAGTGPGPDEASFRSVKDLNKMVHDVEKRLKKIHKDIKDAEKGKGKKS
jgi:hypothetical protein